MGANRHSKRESIQREGLRVHCGGACNASSGGVAGEVFVNAPLRCARVCAAWDDLYYRSDDSGKIADSGISPIRAASTPILGLPSAKVVF